MFVSQFGKEHDLARPVLFKGCNAVLERPGGSLWASREAVVRGVAPLGKDAPLTFETRLAVFNALGCNRFTTR
jgi:hypothetical protein